MTTQSPLTSSPAPASALTIAKRKELQDIERLERACLASGCAGLLALKENSPLTPELQAFYCEQISAWINRELSDYRPTVSANKSRFAIDFAQCGPSHISHFHLRFVPSKCRWLLLFKGMPGQRSTWWVHLPAHNHKCLSLTDWLGQVRQLVTRPLDQATA